MFVDLFSFARHPAISTMTEKTMNRGDHPEEEKKDSPSVGGANSSSDYLQKQQRKAVNEDESWTKGPPPLASLDLSPDHAFGHTSHSTAAAMNAKKNKKGSSSFMLNILGHFLRFAILDFPLMVLFALYVGTVLLHQIHDDYLLPQLKLMKFLDDGRDYTDTTYYHRVCNNDDITANSVEELVIGPNATTQDAVENMLTHGASMYPNLLTPETAWTLREFIAEENHKQEGWFVIENKHRYSWGIDMDMHPALRTYWKELASNRQLVKALEAIVGPDPAIIEFTAITSAYGAKDQYDHQDVVPPASGAKFARTFVPSYSLFIPLQDTSYDMGATHICPGSHLCSAGCEDSCPARNLPMSGDNVWPQGWGALVNQQTTHKGMGHFKEGGLDRVVIIATFAPRPQTHRALETRMIGQGGSYSLKWDHWGHTFSDFLDSEKRMTRIKRIMRSLGLIKGNGWNMVSVTSMRISNSDNGYNDKSQLDEFIAKGGFWFLPKSWQGKIKKEKLEEKNPWYKFLFGTLRRTEEQLKRLNILAFASYAVAICLADLLRFMFKRFNGSIAVRSMLRIIVTHATVLAMAFCILHVVRESNWAKDIKSAKAYRLPVYEPAEGSDLPPETIPTSSDILIAPHYASNYLASYGRILDYTHRGNMFWKKTTRDYSDGYNALSPQLQQEFCDALIESVRTERRFLKQDLGRSWIPIEDQEELSYFCRKSLIAAKFPLKEALLHQIEALKTEAHLGRFQNSSMSTIVIPKLIQTWERFFVPPIAFDAGKKKEARKKQRLLPRNFAVIKPAATSNPPIQALPPRPAPQEPYKGAWLKTGDVVEGKYKCMHNEWYKGILLRAYANSLQYTVQYEDGEIDEDLERGCVRRFVPYKLGESAEVRDEDNDGNMLFFAGKIIHVYDDDTFDFKTNEDEIIEGVTSADLRRFSPPKPLKVGSRVLAQYNGGDEWFPGRITKRNKDGTFAIRYDDGDYEKKVPKDSVQHQDYDEDFE